MKNIFVMIIPFLFLVSSSFAGHIHKEKWYQDRWCAQQGGQTEVVLADRTRCDCLTSSHAIEFDFGSKWAEAIGQALYYSIQTGKQAGVVLILEEQKDYKYWLRLNTIIDHYKLPIETWIAKPDGSSSSRSKTKSSLTTQGRFR